MSTRTDTKQSALTRRIRHFYDLLNGGDFGQCRKMIDPRVRAKSSSVTLFQYQSALNQFAVRFGPIEILDISISVHLNEPSKLYEGRDFAVGETTWEDQRGQRHVFAERWVREGRLWYTRSTGFVTPAVENASIPLPRAEGSLVFPRSRKIKSQ
jgi:hypothetical protein